MTGPAHRTETTSESHRDLITGVRDRSIGILPMERVGTPDPEPGPPSLPGAPTNTNTTTRQDPKSKIADEVRTSQGAGGVGGLLAISDRSNPDAQVGSSGPLDRAAPARPYRHRYPAYDANGNIGQLLDEAGGVVASYAYDPFGNVTEMAGPEAAENPWRFSTKPVEEVTGWSYYGYRYYMPTTGRWASRDPIGERGGYNLYGFVGNEGVGRIDYLGLIDPIIPYWPSDPPLIPSGPPADENSGPHTLVLAFLLGSAPRSLSYDDSHRWTAEMKKHKAVERALSHMDGWVYQEIEDDCDLESLVAEITEGWRGAYINISHFRDHQLGNLAVLSGAVTNGLAGMNPYYGAVGSFFGEITAEGDCCDPSSITYTVVIENEMDFQSLFGLSARPRVELLHRGAVKQKWEFEMKYDR